MKALPFSSSASFTKPSPPPEGPLSESPPPFRAQLNPHPEKPAQMTTDSRGHSSAPSPYPMHSPPPSSASLSQPSCTPAAQDCVTVCPQKVCPRLPPKAATVPRLHAPSQAARPALPGGNRTHSFRIKQGLAGSRLRSTTWILFAFGSSFSPSPGSEASGFQRPKFSCLWGWRSQQPQRRGKSSHVEPFGNPSRDLRLSPQPPSAGYTLCHSSGENTRVPTH